MNFQKPKLITSLKICPNIKILPTIEAMAVSARQQFKTPQISFYWSFNMIL